jgi:two-component system, OmpR family, KDP operon response regulator KdpE
VTGGKTAILVVDDEVAIIKYIRAILSENDYRVSTATDGVAAVEVAERELPGLIVLDIMMPKMDGFEVCRRLREWTQVPIIMLSARADEADKVRCFDLGADDYVTKPFSSEELKARVRAILRRADSPGAIPTRPVFTSGRLEVNFSGRRVTVAGREARLTRTEFDLLQELVLNANKVLTHRMLLQKVWGPEHGDEKEYLHVFIHHLRKELEHDPVHPSYIVTVPSVGYRFETDKPTIL